MKAGPEEGEPSLEMLSDLFRSVTAENNGHYACSFITTVQTAYKKGDKLHRTKLNDPDGNLT